MELAVVSLLQFIDPLRQLGVAPEELPQAYKCPYDRNVHIDRTIAVQDA